MQRILRTSTSTRSVFRLPGDRWSDFIRDEAEKGMRTILWAVDSRDWTGPGADAGPAGAGAGQAGRDHPAARRRRRPLRHREGPPGIIRGLARGAWSPSPSPERAPGGGGRARGILFGSWPERLSPEQQRRLGELLNVTPVATELGERFATAGHELYLVGGLGARRSAGPPRRRPGLRHRRLARGDRADPPRLGRRQYLTGVKFGTVDAAKDEHRLHITTFRQESYPRRPQSGRVLRRATSRPTCRAGTSRSTRWRSAAGRRVRRPLRRLRIWRSAHRHPARAPGVLLGRPASHAAGRPVRRLARGRRREGGRGRHDRDARAPVDRLARADPGRAQQAAGGAPALAGPGPGGRDRPRRPVPAGAPGAALEQDPVHQHKDVLRHTWRSSRRSTRTTVCCASPRCSTTSASRRPASSPTTACSSTTTRSWARAWPRSACASCATPNAGSTTS